MSGSRRPGSAPRQWTVVVAAALAVVATVVADVVAGSHLGHVASVGALAAILGVARVRSTGRHSARFAVLSALIALQPALGAVTSFGVAAPGWHTVDVDDLASVGQVGLVVVIVVAIGSAEAVLDAVADGFRSSLAVLIALARALVGDQRTPIVHEDAARPAGDGVPRPGRRAWRHDARRRGPPVLRAA